MNPGTTSNISDFLWFLITKRGFINLVAAAWGFMVGGVLLLTGTITLVAFLGGSAWIATVLCTLLGGYVAYFAHSGMKKLYQRASRFSIIVVGRLFALATLYGLIAPFHLSYLLLRIYYLKRKLAFLINENNHSALQRRQKLNDLHKRAVKLKNDYKKMSLTMPRGSNQLTVLNLEIEKIRHNIQDADVQNESYLLECRRKARDLGVVLWEKENEVMLPPNITVMHLLSVQIRRFSTLG